ncbi:MAG: nucleotidyltransferase domain-containing protein [Bacteroidetes bacterium]|nr:MAG: nucleotidyltransferase domain-containing protein [Bacteroidota bacterium]
MVQGEIINIIRQYIKNLNAGGISIQFAYLYGSHARNEATPESDIDVLLVGDVFDTNDDVILSKPWLPKFRNDHRIEPIAIGTNRFETEDVSPIIELVKQEGIRIQP